LTSGNQQVSSNLRPVAAMPVDQPPSLLPLRFARILRRGAIAVLRNVRIHGGNPLQQPLDALRSGSVHGPRGNGFERLNLRPTIVIVPCLMDCQGGKSSVGLFAWRRPFPDDVLQIVTRHRQERQGHRTRKSIRVNEASPTRLPWEIAAAKGEARRALKTRPPAR
jgi:hypothetical protein